MFIDVRDCIISILIIARHNFQDKDSLTSIETDFIEKYNKIYYHKKGDRCAKNTFGKNG